MALKYPSVFPADLRVTIDTILERAEMDFGEVGRCPDVSQSSSPEIAAFHANLRSRTQRLVMTVFFAFARAACELGQRRHWTPEHLRMQTEDFLEELAWYEYYKKLPGPSFEFFLHELKLEIEKSDDWKEHCKARTDLVQPAHGISAADNPANQEGDDFHGGAGAAQQAPTTPRPASDVDGAELRLVPGSLPKSVRAKVKAIDAELKTRLNQGSDRDRVVCESLQKCFDLLATELIETVETLNSQILRKEIPDILLKIAVFHEWLPPAMSPDSIAWGHREWLMKLLEGRIAYFESCLPGETPGNIDKLGYVVLRVPETDAGFQSEVALEELRKQASQPPRVFDIETLKLHASSAYSVPPEEVTPQQLGATIDAFMRKYGSVRVVHGAALRSAEDSSAGAHSGEEPSPATSEPPIPESVQEPTADLPSPRGEAANGRAIEESSTPSANGPDDRLDFTSDAGRNTALATYTKHWACSQAGLARTARVHPADLSKWKKGLLPAESDKKARIENALKNNDTPTPPPRRSEDS
jgi:hypothetical protein